MMLKRILPILILSLIVASIQGCAVITDAKGGTNVGLDTAAIFGESLGQFALPNGDHGVLRRAGKTFSIKLDKYGRVIELPGDITSVRIARVENIGPRTAVILETQRPNCPYTYFMLGIHGSEASLFYAKDCGRRPVVYANADRSALLMDFAQPNGKVSRYAYTQNGQTLFGIMEPTPFEHVHASPFATENLDAAADNSAPQSTARRPARGPRNSRRAAAAYAPPNAPTNASIPSAPPPLPVKLELPRQNVTPVKIDLRD